MSLAKYIKIVERVSIDDPGSYKVPEPIRNLGDGFETVNHNGQKGIKDTQTGKLILMSTKLPNVFNIVTVQDGREVTEYGLNFNELGPATQRALQKIGAGGVQETYESSEQVRSIVQRMMEDARVPQKPRQGPLRPQTGAGKHKDKKKEQKQGKDKHKKPFMEQGVAKGSGAKYKVKSIGKDNKGEYHISPSTGKKVYKSGANKGDHENPKTGEIKKSVAEAGSANQQAAIAIAMKKAGKKPKDVEEAKYQKLTPQQKFKNSMKRAGYDMDAGAKRLQDLLDKQKKEREEKENGGFKVHFEAIQRDLKLPDSYYLQLSSGAKSNLKNLYINYILESVSGVKKDTLETVSYPELKNIVRMIEEKQKGVDGKACWKGYKRMGTKKKGDRTVDNCVKAESLQEKSPPGFKGTVKAMKKHPELTKGKTKDGKEKNPWALAWHMKNKGYKSHKKADGSDKD